MRVQKLARVVNAPFVDPAKCTRLHELALHMQHATKHQTGSRGADACRGINYFSCFSGAECGGQALLKLKVPWNLLITLESNKHAQQLLRTKFPADPAKRTATLCPHLFDSAGTYIGPDRVIHLCVSHSTSTALLHLVLKPCGGGQLTLLVGQV